MDISLKGKNAVVTGASRGIGRAIAVRLAEAGANVAALYSSDSEGAAKTLELARESEATCVAVKCDVSGFESCALAVKEITAALGKIDILVNNAGITRDALTPAMSEADFDAVINVNLKGCFNMIRHCYRGFMRGGGRIINISSVAGLTGNPGQLNYCASKAGMVGLTKSVAKELASRGVTCNAIAPGFIISDMTGALPEQAKNELLSKIPAGRCGSPEDVANAVLFLASELASYITGEIIRVDGGMAM